MRWILIAAAALSVGAVVIFNLATDAEISSWYWPAIAAPAVVALTVGSGGRSRRQTFLRILLAGWLPLVAGLTIVFGAVTVGNWKSPQVTLIGLLGFAVLCGVVAMIVVETMKRLLPVRSAFQRKLVATWLIERSDDERGLTAMGELVFGLGLNDDVKLHSSSIGEKNAYQLGQKWARRPWLPQAGVDSVFNLPPEQLTAQIGQLVEMPPGSEPPALPVLFKALAPGKHSDIDIPLAIDQLHVLLAGRWRHYLQGT